MTDTPSESLEIEYEADTGIYRVHFDPGSIQVTDAVVRTLSEVTGSEADQLEELNSVVDPIIVNALVRRRRRDFRLTFEYNDHVISVDSNGKITVRPTENYNSLEYSRRVKDEELPTTAVVEAIADVKGIEPTALAPLYSQIDTDALDAIFDGPAGTDQRDLQVSFQVKGLQVVLSGDQWVGLHPIPGY